MKWVIILLVVGLIFVLVIFHNQINFALSQAPSGVINFQKLMQPLSEVGSGITSLLNSIVKSFTSWLP